MTENKWQSRKLFGAAVYFVTTTSLLVTGHIDQETWKHSTGLAFFVWVGWQAAIDGWGGRWQDKWSKR